jgi:hypothetical protein
VNLIFVSPQNIIIISRRIVVKHTSGLLKREFIESITIFNNSEKKVEEIAIEMEEFRNELSVYDESGVQIPFLPKEEIKKKILSFSKACLDGDKAFLAYLNLSSSGALKPNSYKIINFSYVDYEDPSQNIYDSASQNQISRAFENLKSRVYRAPFYNISLEFFGMETTSISFVFEEGISHESGLILLARDSNNEEIPGDLEESFHYILEKHFCSLSISGRKRKNKDIHSIEVLYAVVPDKELRQIVNSITLFSLIFPFIVLYLYFYFKNLSLLGIMSTTDLLAIISLGLNKFQTGLISIKKRLIISLLLLVTIYFLILIL